MLDCNVLTTAPARLTQPPLPRHTASEHLLAERDKLDAKLQLLQEERALIDQHLAEQRNKQGDLARTEGALRERAALVRGTLGNLQVWSMPLWLVITLHSLLNCS